MQKMALEASQCTHCPLYHIAGRSTSRLNRAKAGLKVKEKDDRYDSEKLIGRNALNLASLDIRPIEVAKAISASSTE